MATGLFAFLLFLSFSISSYGLQNTHVVDIHSLMSSSACSSPKGMHIYIYIYIYLQKYILAGFLLINIHSMQKVYFQLSIQ
jgi:hypothetical protein